MFTMFLRDGLAWIAVIGFAVLAFAFLSAPLGALIGNTIVAFRRYAKQIKRTVDAD
jgi:hypothetical protein